MISNLNIKESIYFRPYAIWIIFFINPFLCLLLSLKNLSERTSQYIITAFCGFYGYTFVTQRTSMDSYRHRLDFIDWSTRRNLSFDQFVDFLYGDNFTSADILLPFLKYFISRFTNNPDFLYLILGLLFGYFFARNVSMVYSFSKNKKLGVSLFILIGFIYLIAPWEINSFRFWMAAHIFFSAAFPYFILGEKRKIWLIAVTPFIHFSFFYAIVVFVFYKILGNRVTLYFVLFITSLFISNINPDSIKNTLPKTGINVLENRKDVYIKEMEDSEIESQSKLNWYVKGRQIPFKIITVVMIILYFWKERTRIRNSEMISLFSFSLLFLGLSLIFFSTIPQFGRFYRLSLLFVYSFFFVDYFKYRPKFYYYLKYPFAFSVLFYAIVDSRIALDTFSIDTFLSNPIVAVISKTNIPTIDLIK
ncbi:hypothetical protein GCM10027036_38790 [Flavihumibacter cheonanensis]